VILAKDPIGTRHLYYSFDNNQVTWSTILDPLVRLAGKTFALNEEYIAGWFSMFPAVDLTPCVGIHSVPPSSSVLLRPGKHISRQILGFRPKE
jgi:asparagine synthetase B (glutamine-hydrolysing)